MSRQGVPDTSLKSLLSSLSHEAEERDPADSGCNNSSGIAVTVMSDW